MQFRHRAAADRRRFFKLSLLGTLFALWRPARATRSFSDLSALRAYLDTLIPAHLGPGALALDVDRRLLEAASSDAEYLELISRGCMWLNRQARARGVEAFQALAETERELIVHAAAQAPRHTGEWIFFQRTRADAFRVYYADPRAWEAVGIAGPPQPHGYPDYADPPGSP